MVTIGEQSDKIAEEYFQMYKTFREDKTHPFNNKSLEQIYDLTMCDLKVKKMVYEFAIDKLKELVEQYEDEEEE